MNRNNLFVIGGFVSVIGLSLFTGAPASQAATHYVNASGTNPVSPYSDWATAATNIQDAIDIAIAGDTVLVTNGVYSNGGRAMQADLTNRVALHKALTVQSVNGPLVTTIQGRLDVATNGPLAVRCAWLTNNAILNGFTLTQGATRALNGSNPINLTSGAGVWGSSTAAIVTNCIITGCYAGYQGGGVYQATVLSSTVANNHSIGAPGFTGGAAGGAARSTLINCLITNNVAETSDGGAASQCTLKNCAVAFNSSYRSAGAAISSSLLNCTVVGNRSDLLLAGSMGAVYSSSLTNCVVWGNFRPNSSQPTNYDSSCVLERCCAAPLAPGIGNISVDPQFAGDGIHISSNSPCFGAGTGVFPLGLDIDSQTWNTPPSMGCDEWHPEPVLGFGTSLAIDKPAHGLTFSASGTGQTPLTYQWIKDGTPILADSHYAGVASSTLVAHSFGPSDVGLYQIVISNGFGMVTGSVGRIVVHSVDANSTSPLAPYATWATAANSIQDAIDNASPGDIVLVTNGVYATGGKITGALSNRVVINKPLFVTSVTGPAATIIEGKPDPITTNGVAAVRCVWLTNGATLNGFTLRNGATLAYSNAFPIPADQMGGGAYAVSKQALVSNCVLTNNNAINGGGFANGSIRNSLIIGNNCSLFGYGGGTFWAFVTNCTILYNSLESISITYGAGCSRGISGPGNICNSIILNNFLTPFGTTANYDMNSPTASFCCSSPTPSGTGNTNAEPVFVSLGHLAANSPLRGKGDPNAVSGNDADGEPWGTPPSIGWDEVANTSFTGPLSVDLTTPLAADNFFVGYSVRFLGSVTGFASRIEWSFGTGTTYTNLSYNPLFKWQIAGDYPVTFTAYNDDYPAGVTTNIIAHILVPSPAPIFPPTIVSNQVRIQFGAQGGVTYWIETTPSLTPPVNWSYLNGFYSPLNMIATIYDPASTNQTRFYHVRTR